MTLDLDQCLAHVSPWDFQVVIAGRTLSTRRPSVGELGILQNLAGHPIAAVGEVADSFFTVPPGVRWELPVLMTFFAAYLEYFRIHGEKKEQAADAAAAHAVKVIRQQLTSSGPSSPPC